MAKKKYIGNVRLKGPERENVMTLNYKHTEVYVILLELDRFNE